MPKMLVETISATGALKKRYNYEGNKLLIRKGKDRHAGYNPRFSKNSIIPYRTGFGPLKFWKHKVILIDGADECLNFNAELPEAEIPVWDRKSEEKLFEANVIKASGTVSNKIQIPTLFYLLLIFPTILGFVNILIMTGRLRI